MDNTKPTFISEAVGKTTAPLRRGRPNVHSLTARMPDGSGSSAIRSEVSYILRSPPSLGLRKRKGEVDDCGCCCIRNTHSLNRANQEGGEQDREVGEKEERVR